MNKNKKIKYESSFTTDAVDLFVHTRWDIIAKYIYIKNLINYYEAPFLVEQYFNN